MTPPSPPAAASAAGSFPRPRSARRSPRLLRLALLTCSLLLWNCQPYPPGPPCSRDPDCYDSRPYDDSYPYGPQSGSPADLPKGERLFGLVLDQDLRIWFDAFDAVPREVYIGSGPDAASALAHDLRDTRPWYLAYGGRTEALYPSVTAWDHSGPTAHVRIRLDRSYAGDPLTLDLEIRHGFQGRSHTLIEAYQAHGLHDGESVVVRVGGEVSRGGWRQAWSAGGNGYLRGSSGREELWMPGNGYHEAKVEFR